MEGRVGVPPHHSPCLSLTVSSVLSLPCFVLQPLLNPGLELIWGLDPDLVWFHTVHRSFFFSDPFPSIHSFSCYFLYISFPLHSLFHCFTICASFDCCFLISFSSPLLFNCFCPSSCASFALFCLASFRIFLAFFFHF